ncbi:MAG: Zn-ribbon domain-containing OB-fold protein [Acidimicrobiia bacterium]
MFEKITNPEKVRLFQGRMPVSHRYTAGLAGEEFFSALRDRGVFLATRCEDDGVTYAPARAFCERCLKPLDEYFEVGPIGTLESFTVVHRDLEDQKLDDPVVIGLIRLDGADTLLVHRIDGQARTDLEIGIPVEPVIKPRSARTGNLNDVEHFRPIRGPVRSAGTSKSSKRKARRR